MRTIILALLLSGCASFDDHDFCALFVNDNGVTRCVAWVVK